MYNNSLIMRASNPGLGVVGGFFKFNDLPEVYGISNNHVIANFNQCVVGDEILDGETAHIGSLTHWLPLVETGGAINKMDLALFKFDDPTDLSWHINSSGPNKPAGFIGPVMGGHVYMLMDKKIRKGYISDPNISFVQDFAMGNKTYSFRNLIEIGSMDTAPFSTPGDSGSVIMSEDNHCIVGLLVGTNSTRDKSYAVPFINGILDKVPLTIY